MHFENRFDVDAPIERVWETVLDVERVAPTVPGAQVLERTGDDAYKVAITVRVGPMSMTYRGEVEITERDESAHRAVMKARAKESRGQGTADADVTMVLSGADAGGRAEGARAGDAGGRARGAGRCAGRAAAPARRGAGPRLDRRRGDRPAPQGPAGARGAARTRGAHRLPVRAPPLNGG